MIIIAACIPTLSKIGSKATSFFRSYFTRSRFSSRKYAGHPSGESSSASKSRYLRHESEADDRSLELPIIENELVPSGTSESNVITTSDSQDIAKAEVRPDRGEAH